MNIIAICKDCGNGTLNGETNPQFELAEIHGYETVVCLRCNRSHVDVVSIEELDGSEEDLNFGPDGRKWSQDTERVAE